MNDYDSITWNSLNEAAVSIDKDGTVKLKKRGSSAIVATLTRGGIVYQAQYDLKVYGPVEYVFVSLVNYVKRIFPKP